MASIRRKGTSAINERPDSPVFENTEQGPKYTRTWTASYDALMAAQPKRGDTMAGTPAGFQVDTVRIQKQPGAQGLMTVTFAPAGSVQQDYTFGANVTYDMEWLEIQKPIEQHPMFFPADQSSHPSAGKYSLTDEEWTLVDKWKNGDSGDRAIIEANATSYNPNILELIKRLKRGQDSYVIYAPLCRRTRKYASKPTTARCGHQEDPPEAIKVPGYKYLKTADRATRDRTWSRTEEWTGADMVDNDAYPPPP